MRKNAIFAIGLLLACSTFTHAQRLINIDFGAHTNPAFSVKTSRAATGLSDQDYWNLYSRDGANGSFLSESELINLKLSDGTSTDADLVVRGAPGAWFTLNPDPMFESYLYPGNPNIETDFLNIPSGTYDIYVYAHGQPAAENAVIEVRAGAASFPAQATSTSQNWDSLGWREGSQYVVFRGVQISSSERLSVISKPGAARMAVINGIQLMEVLPQAPEIIADWTFEEGAIGQVPATVLDHSGNGRHGDTFGSPQFVSGQSPGNGNVALRFGSGNGFRAENSSVFNFKRQDFTLEAIINPGPDNVAANRGIIVAQNPENGGLAFVLDYASENRTANFALVESSGFNEFVSAEIPVDGEPHHLGAVRDGNVLRIYLDKGLVDQKSITTIPNLSENGAVELRVGGSSAGFSFDGTMERVRIWRGALDPDEFAFSAPPSGHITIHAQPADITVPSGSSGEFHVAATSELPLSYQWLMNGGEITGATSPVLRIENVTFSDAGLYSVRISNASTSITSTQARLRVFATVTEPLLNIDFGAHLNPYFRSKSGPAAIGKGPSDQWNLYSRDDAQGNWLDNNQLVNLLWSDGAGSSIRLAVTNAAGAWYTLSDDPMLQSYLYPISRTGNVSAVLSELPGGMYDAYIYSHGQIPSENAIIELSTEIASYGTKSTSTAENWDLPAWTEGNQFVLFRDIEVRSGGELRVLVRPGQNDLAVINGIQLVRRTGTSNAADIVFHRQPENLIAAIGEAAEFSVEATSGLPLEFQWFFNDAEIPGGTNSQLHIQSVQPHHHGTYFVRVSNGLRTAQSRTVQLQTFTRTAHPLMNIDFGAHENPRFTIKTGPAAIGRNTSDRWNLYSRDDGRGGWLPNNQLSNLVWSDGSQSAVHLSVFNAAGAWYTLNEDPMLESYLYPLSRVGNIDSLIAGLPAGSYDILVYAHGQIPRENGVIEIRTDSSVYGTKATSSTNDWDKPAWHENGEYVSFNDVQVGSGETLQVIAKPGTTGLSVINGVQLILRDGDPGEFNPTVADWTFEEGTPGERAVVAEDSSGNEHDLSAVSGTSARFVTTTRGPGEVSVNFAPVSGGIGNALRANDGLAFNLGTEFTIEASLTAGAQNTEFNRGIVVGQDAASGRLAYGLDYRSENRAIHFLVSDALGRGDSVEALLPDDGRSHHIAGVFSGGILRIYLDKALVASKATTIIPGLTPGGAGRVTLGANDIGGFWFDGTLDRVRISREALTPGEFFPHEIEPENPLVIVQPLQDMTVAEGARASFRVVASGATNLTYRWSFNGQTLSNLVSDTLFLNNVRLADAGAYTVTVSSGPWVISSSAVLTVLPPDTSLPVITAHPQSRVAALGFSAQFSVAATSPTPISYQWFFNGAAIPGETNAFLAILDVAAEDEGTYHVTVANSSGSVTSQPAILNAFSSTFSGGTVFLDNHRPGVDAPVTDDHGQRLAGTAFLVQLYSSAPGQPARPVGAAIPFGVGENAGYFSDPVERVIPGTAPGEQAPLEVRAWDSSAGRTFEEAVANGGLHGISNPLVVTLGGGGTLPATLASLESFSLGSRPRITQQPESLTVIAGNTAAFEVRATGTAPLVYQWKFTNSPVGQNGALLVLSNVTEIQAGEYTVEISNNFGAVTSTVARLTVQPRDTQLPVVVINSPVAGVSTNSSVMLAGSVSDNGAVTRVEWLRNGQPVGLVPFTNGTFSLPDVVLFAGTNNLTVVAYDDHGNLGSASVEVVFEPQRSVSIGMTLPVPEGQMVLIPIEVESIGDIGALSFSITYDTNYFTEPSLQFLTVQGSPFTQANLEQPGIVHGTYVLPGRTIPGGTQQLANLFLRARSVPERLTSPISLEVHGVYSAAGDAILTGTTVTSGEVEVLRRKIVGDNNSNDRLDVSDASILIRMLTLLEPIRSWDISGNDLNQNGALDAGDIIRVLRAVVGLDPQPAVPGNGRLVAQSVQEPAANASLTVRPDKTRLVPGEQVTMQLLLDASALNVTGASFALEYPTNALRLENEEVLAAGLIVPASAMSLWHVAPDHDFQSQDGRVNFATSAATPWSTNSGVIAELTFTVQPGATNQVAWPVRVLSGEAAAGIDLVALGSSEILLEGREPQPVTLSDFSLDQSNNTFTLHLSGEPGLSYRIESSEDLRSWSEVAVVTPANGLFILTDTIQAGAPRRFYRAHRIE